MSAFVPRFGGYHNDTLGIAGVAVAFPVGASRALVQVSAGCYLGIAANNTLLTFNNTNYGSIQGGHPIEVTQAVGRGSYIHIAPWATTAIVSILFG